MVEGTCDPVSSAERQETKSGGKVGMQSDILTTGAFPLTVKMGKLQKEKNLPIGNISVSLILQKRLHEVGILEDFEKGTF